MLITAVWAIFYADAPEQGFTPISFDPGSEKSAAGSSTTPARERQTEQIGGNASNVDSAPASEETAAQQAWEHRHGYFYSNRADYINLSDNELEQLMESGDVAAAQFLAARYTLSDPNQAIALYETAASYGSTYALIAITDLIRLHASEDPKLITRDADLGVLALTYTYAAEIRGNNTASGIKKAEVLSEYSLSDTDIESACADAKQLVASLQKVQIRRTGEAFDSRASDFGAPPSETLKPCT